MDYDYDEGLKRVIAILGGSITVKQSKFIPQDHDFTFDNGYRASVIGLFVDIRDSTALFMKQEKDQVARVIRSFTSEIIEILQDENDLRDIGIRGDCVFAVYTTTTPNSMISVSKKAIAVNTYIKMLNVLLNEWEFPTLKIGIGVAASNDLAIKAGRVGSNIEDIVWIGSAVTNASNLSSIGNKDGRGPIVFSKEFYDKVIESLKNEYGPEIVFIKGLYGGEDIFHGNFIYDEYNDWKKSRTE